MAIKVAINGFGRIGRNMLRAGRKLAGIEFVAVNDLTDSKTLAHLLAHDSVHGAFPDAVHADGDALQVGGQRIKVLSVKNPAGGVAVVHRSPQDIMDEIAALDVESAEVLGNIRALL